ncbi:hypothetical protein ACA910_008240 [Epithemia clementina (nom. ined.)]
MFRKTRSRLSHQQLQKPQDQPEQEVAISNHNSDKMHHNNAAKSPKASAADQNRGRRVIAAADHANHHNNKHVTSKNKQKFTTANNHARGKSTSPVRRRREQQREEQHQQQVKQQKHQQQAQQQHASSSPIITSFSFPSISSSSSKDGYRTDTDTSVDYVPSTDAVAASHTLPSIVDPDEAVAAAVATSPTAATSTSSSPLPPPPPASSTRVASSPPKTSGRPVVVASMLRRTRSPTRSRINTTPSMMPPATTTTAPLATTTMVAPSAGASAANHHHHRASSPRMRSASKSQAATASFPAIQATSTTPATPFPEHKSQWRSFVRADDPNAPFPTQAGRYHLYAATGCPLANRTMMVRKLKGLEDVISMTLLLPTFRRTRPELTGDHHSGWVFATGTAITTTPDENENKDPSAATSPSSSNNAATPITSDGKVFYYTNPSGRGGPFPSVMEGCEPDPEFGAFSLREVYERAAGATPEQKLGPYTVPVLWDKETKTIVNNDSVDIMRMFNSEFNAFCTHPQLDLYPPSLQAKMDPFNDWMLTNFNNGVHKCGQVGTQAEYNAAIASFTQAFDRVESMLQKSRFLMGENTLTEADVRLFVTLIRIDEIYAILFKANTRLVAASPALLNYCRDIYQFSHGTVSPSSPKESNPETGGGADGGGGNVSAMYAKSYMASPKPHSTTTNSSTVIGRDVIKMDQIKQHYFTSMVGLNKSGIIPEGRNFQKLLEEPHNRWKIGHAFELVLRMMPVL